MAPSDTIPTVSISIPLQTVTDAADAQPEGEVIPEHESGWSIKKNVDTSKTTHSLSSVIGRSLQDERE